MGSAHARASRERGASLWRPWIIHLTTWSIYDTAWYPDQIQISKVASYFNLNCLITGWNIRVKLHSENVVRNRCHVYLVLEKKPRQNTSWTFFLEKTAASNTLWSRPKQEVLTQGGGNAFATPRSSTWIVLNCILFVIVLDSCCISIGHLTRDCLVFLKGRQVSSLGCFVFEIWVLRSSVFVFETTLRFRAHY